MTPTRTRVLVGALHLTALAVLVAGLAAQVARPLAPPLEFLPDVGELFGAGYLERVRAYRLPRYAGALIALAISVLVPAWWALSCRGRGLTARVIAAAGPHRPGRAAAGLAVALVVAVDLASFPVAFGLGFVQDGAYGFRTQGLAGWSRDWVVVRAPGWLGVAVATPFVLLAVRRLPRAWPPVLGLAAGILAAALTLAAPLVLEPLWLRTTPLPEGAVRTEVERVVAAAGLPVERIVVGDASRRTTKANAYVSGLGRTRRVVLFDTLLQQAGPGEVALVVAHELAHHRHGDIGRGVLLGAAGGLVSAYALALMLRRATATGALTSPADPRAVPLAAFALSLLLVLSLPVQGLVSRRAEAAADWTALELTGDPVAFAAMQRTLARSHLADPSPPDWVRLLWHSHPTVRERLGLAELWTRRSGGGSPAP